MEPYSSLDEIREALNIRYAGANWTYEQILEYIELRLASLDKTIGEAIKKRNKWQFYIDQDKFQVDKMWRAKIDLMRMQKEEEEYRGELFPVREESEHS